jgi:hydroxymethylpyrimidine/phosphomethylpyrimidine kinase
MRADLTFPLSRDVNCDGSRGFFTASERFDGTTEFRRMQHVLTIAGSDSGGGAGIQADLKTFAAHGVYGASAITAVTAQNTERVAAVHVLPPSIVAAQIDAVASDIRLDGVKTGMLATAAIVEAVAAAIARWRLGQVVIDPVMVAKSGDRLLDEEAIIAVRGRLLPLCAVVTPNRHEAEVLAGMPVRTHDEAREAARRIASSGSPAVVIKGGHFEGPYLINLLFDGRDFTEIESERVDTTSTHGTGCTFAASIAAHLACGRSLPDAVQGATEYVAGAIRNAVPLGHGHGPVNHFWQRAEHG